MTRRRVPIGLAALAAVALAACSGGDGEVVTGDLVGDPVDVSPLREPGTHDLGPSPLSERRDAGVAWTGDALFVWGGVTVDGASEPGRSIADGAVFDVTDGTWRRLPTTPFTPSLFHPVAVWDGTEVIVVGMECEVDVPPPTEGGMPPCPKGPAAGGWNPTTNEWRRLPPPPIGPMDRAVGGEGTAAFATWYGEPEQRFVRWDRDGERWEEVESPGGPWNEICIDVEQGRLVASGVAGEEVRVARLRWFDPDEPTWSAPVDVPGTFGSSFGCGRGYAMASSYGASTAIGTGTTIPASGSAPTLPSSVVTEVDFASGDVRTEDLGPTFLGVRIVGPWLFQNRLDEDWYASWQRSMSTTGAPPQDTDLGDPPRTLLTRRVDQLDWRPASAEAPSSLGYGQWGEGAWTGERWLGLRAGSTGDGAIRFIAWVPPED